MTDFDRETIQAVARSGARRRARAVVAALVLLAAALGLEGCKSLPGGDGEYATHDRGALNRGP